MIKIISKKVLLILYVFFFLFVVINSCFVQISGKYDNADNAYIHDMIFDSMSDVDNHLNGMYSKKTNYHLSTDHNYAVLATDNINQLTLGDKYNELPIIHDLNKDGVIDSNDKLRTDQGICQPIAVTMALRYMKLKKMFSYVPKVNSNELDEINILYDVVSAYISNGWQGGGATREMCYKSINKFFENIGSDYRANYYNKDMILYLDAGYENYIPLIGHITGDDGGHAVTIAGYVKKTVTYEDRFLWRMNNYNLKFYYAIINTGWYDSPKLETMFIPDGWYENNYSYIDMKNMAGITYIYKQ